MTELSAIFNNGRISAFYRERNKNTLVICFAPRQKDHSPWGKTFLEKFDASVLYLVDCRSSWFPVEDMITLKEALNTKLVMHKKIMTFGFSMGGYAALKFSKLFNSNFNLVFSPQYSIDGNVVGHFDNRRPRQFFDKKLHNGMQIEKRMFRG